MGPYEQDSRGREFQRPVNHLALTPGETHDNRLCSVLLSALLPQTMLLADCGYDADWIRKRARSKERGQTFHRNEIAKTGSASARIYIAHAT
jgi:IS5 family transposase